MSSTISSTTSYVTPAQFLQFVDSRWTGDRVGDTGVRVSASNLLTDPNLAAILSAASGKLEAALFRSGRYTLQDLQSISGQSLSYLQQLVSYVAAWMLWVRRPMGAPLPQAWTEALTELESLAKGEWIFGLDTKATAGLRITITAPNHLGQSLPTPLSTRAHRLLGQRRW